MFASWCHVRLSFLHRQGASFLSAGGRGGQRRAERLLPVRRYGQSFRERAFPAGGENTSSFYVAFAQAVSQRGGRGVAGRTSSGEEAVWSLSAFPSKKTEENGCFSSKNTANLCEAAER